MKLDGSCLCGSVKYTVDNEFKVTMNCHCKHCRKAHAAPYITASLMPFKDITIKQGGDLISKYDFGQARKRCFCSNCGTRLFNEVSVPGFVTLMVGTLENPEAIKPSIHINLESKLETLEINDELPKYPAFPSQEEIRKLLSK